MPLSICLVAACVFMQSSLIFTLDFAVDFLLFGQPDIRFKSRFSLKLENIAYEQLGH